MEDKKKAAIDEINRCQEWQQAEKKVAMMFANHFVKYADAYIVMYSLNAELLDIKAI